MGSVIQLPSEEVIRIVKHWQRTKKEVTTTKSNAKQCEFIDAIANRVIQEDKDLWSNTQSEPLRMLIGGGPGVGKSFVIRALTLTLTMTLTLALTITTQHDAHTA